MIKVNKRRGKIAGSEPELLTELSIIVDKIRETGISKERIMDSVNIGLADEDEKMDVMFGILSDKIDSMFSNLKTGGLNPQMFRNMKKNKDDTEE